MRGNQYAKGTQEGMLTYSYNLINSIFYITISDTLIINLLIKTLKEIY